MTELIAGSIRTTTPILLAALSGIWCERVGVSNIALEGLMLLGAFFGILGSFWTGSVMMALLLAMFVSLIGSLIFVYLVEKRQSQPVITALGINMLAVGITTFFMKYIFGDQGSISAEGIVGMKRISIPIIKDIPVLGAIISNHTPLVYVSWILIGLCAFLLYRTSLGINIRMVGDNPKAAESAGIRTSLYKILTVSISGIFCGLAGAYLSLGYVNMFTENMTAGRGFIAFAAVVFGKADPFKVFLASFIFGFAESLSYRVQLFGNIPSSIVMMLPYIITILALVLRSDKINLKFRNRKLAS